MARNRVIGLRLTQDQLHFLNERVEAIIPPTLRELGKLVAEDASAHVGRTKGGDLHVADDMVVTEPEIHGHRMVVKVGPSKRTSWRAKFLEFGTRKMGAHPFLRPARDRHKAAVKQKVKENAAAAAKVG